MKGKEEKKPSKKTLYYGKCCCGMYKFIVVHQDQIRIFVY